MHYALLLLIALLLANAPAEAKEAIKIGVLAYRGKSQTLAQWQPMAVALKQALPEEDFVVDAYAFPELEAAVQQRQIDFILTNPGHYVLLTKKIGLSAPLATLSVDQAGLPSSRFGGVIFGRATANQINVLADIKGKTIAAVSNASFGGYQMQAYELLQAGIRLEQDNQLLFTGMPQDNVVAAVLSGSADLGLVRSGVIEEMIQEGKLDSQQIKVINSQRLDDFPLAVSTRLYPEWAFAVLPQVDGKLARHVAAALYVLEDNTAAVKAMNIHGFVVPPDYTPVADLLKALRLPPFDAPPSFTIADVWLRYLWQIILLLVFLALIALLSVRLLLASRRMSSQHRLVLKQKRLLQRRGARLQAIIENEPECIKIIDADGNLRLMNPAGLAMIECSDPEQVLGKPVLELVAETFRQQFVDMQRLVLSGNMAILIFEICGLNGRRRWIESHAVPLHENGETLLLAVARDITERKLAEDALLESHQMLDSLLNSMAEGAYGVDVQGNCRFVNRSCLAILGYQHAEEMIGQSMHKLCHHSYPDGRPYPVEECRVYAVLRHKEAFSCADEVFWHRDGRAISVEYWVQPIVSHGEIQGAVVTFVDITERKKAEEAIRQSELKFHTLYDSTSDAVIMLDAQSCFDCNKAALKLFGCKDCDELSGYAFARLAPERQPSGSDSAALAAHYLACTLDQGSARFEWQHRRLDNGRRFYADVQMSAMTLAGQKVIQATIRDISERKKLEEQAEQLAFFDPLTQLPNRRLLNERLSQAIALNKRKGQYSALLFLDLDNFKPLNDNYGHMIGDLLLIEVAQRLRECVRDTDTVARFGGDEFVVMLNELNGAEREATELAVKIAEKIRHCLAAPYRLSSANESGEDACVDHQCTASIGLVVFGEAVRGLDILKSADQAMYQAKQAGSNQVHLYCQTP